MVKVWLAACVFPCDLSQLINSTRSTCHLTSHLGCVRNDQNAPLVGIFVVNVTSQRHQGRIESTNQQRQLPGEVTWIGSLLTVFEVSIGWWLRSLPDPQCLACAWQLTESVISITNVFNPACPKVMNMTIVMTVACPCTCACMHAKPFEHSRHGLDWMKKSYVTLVSCLFGTWREKRRGLMRRGLARLTSWYGRDTQQI